jgi:hypothetical protein
MRNRHDRYARYGVVALAGVAVLGWVREPEKPFENPGGVSSAVGSGESRATFSPPPPPPAAVLAFEQLSGHHSVHPDNAGSTPESASFPTVLQPVESGSLKGDQQTSAVRRERALEIGGLHEGVHAAKGVAVNRSPELPKEASEDPEPIERAVGNVDPPQDDVVIADGRTQPVLGKKDRSTGLSAAIIVGATAAGAAIGAASGGRKGAAIGAITGGAGGYVYDRMTRRKGVAGVPTGTHSGADRQVDESKHDNASSLARRFGTPTFN